MNAFQQARTIEDLARAEILPWLEMRSERVEEVPPGLFLQRLAGDYIVTLSGKKYGFELKAEEKHTNNLYLETWSNLPELTPGWMVTSRADYLGYFFLDLGVLYIARMRQLQAWAFGADGKPGQIYRFPERMQSKYSQLNMTTGRIVPVKELAGAELLKEFTLRLATRHSAAQHNTSPGVATQHNATNLQRRF